MRSLLIWTNLCIFKGDRSKKVGVVDSEFIVHQGIQTLGGASAKKVMHFHFTVFILLSVMLLLLAATSHFVYAVELLVYFHLVLFINLENILLQTDHVDLLKVFYLVISSFMQKNLT